MNREYTTALGWDLSAGRTDGEGCVGSTLGLVEEESVCGSPLRSLDSLTVP